MGATSATNWKVKFYTKVSPLERQQDDRSAELCRRCKFAATQLFFPLESGGKEGGTRDCTLCNAARTFISAINSSFFMFCFSVTRIPFSSRMALQRGSTLSLISTEVMEIGAMSTVCVYLCPRFARRGNWC